MPFQFVAGYDFDRQVTEQCEKYGEDVYFVCRGKKVGIGSNVEPGSIVDVMIRCLGGKGGFGSLLRAMGNQISKTTNKDMCRDLTGRRIGDVEKEKKLKDLASKGDEYEQKQREAQEEKRKRRRELLETNGLGVGPKVELKKFYSDKDKISEDLQDALREGLKRKREDEPTTSKASGGCSQTAEAPKPKKKKRWIDEEEEAILNELSDSDSD